MFPEQKSSRGRWRKRRSLRAPLAQVKMTAGGAGTMRSSAGAPQGSVSSSGLQKHVEITPNRPQQQRSARAEECVASWSGWKPRPLTGRAARRNRKLQQQQQQQLLLRPFKIKANRRRGFQLLRDRRAAFLCASALLRLERRKKKTLLSCWQETAVPHFLSAPAAVWLIHPSDTHKHGGSPFLHPLIF